jgi:acyl-CoA hydrolase
LREVVAQRENLAVNAAYEVVLSGDAHAFAVDISRCSAGVGAGGQFGRA